MSDRSFKAKFSTMCLVCDKLINEGEWVLYDGDGQVIHEECDEEKNHVHSGRVQPQK